jgi:hypothetical protein
MAPKNPEPPAFNFKDMAEMLDEELVRDMWKSVDQNQKKEKQD